MAMSDCPKCLETPCRCGYMYQDWSKATLAKQIEMLQKILGWRSLKTDPPGPEHKMFFVGHSKGGRMDYVFSWPHPKTGKPVYWKQGEHGNYIMYDYGPDVWYPGPPTIPGSDVEAIQQGRFFK